MSLSGSVGGVSVALTTDLEASTSSYKFGYTLAGVALTLTGNDNNDAGGDATGISASYAMGALALSASMSDEPNNAKDDTSVGVEYAMNDAITLAYTTI